MIYEIELEPIERYGNDMVVKYWGEHGKDSFTITEAQIDAHYEHSYLLNRTIGVNQNELEWQQLAPSHYKEFCFIDPEFTNELIHHYFILPTNYSGLKIT